MHWPPIGHISFQIAHFRSNSEKSIHELGTYGFGLHVITLLWNEIRCAQSSITMLANFFFVPQSHKMLFLCDEKLSNKAEKKSQLKRVPHTCNAHKLTVFLYIGLHKSFKLADVPCFNGRYAATSVKKWAPTVRKAKLYCSSLDHDASQRVWNSFRLSHDHLHEKRYFQHFVMSLASESIFEFEYRMCFNYSIDGSKVRCSKMSHFSGLKFKIAIQLYFMAIKSMELFYFFF